MRHSRTKLPLCRHTSGGRANGTSPQTGCALYVFDVRVGFRRDFVADIGTYLPRGHSLQVYSDGGLRGAMGAAAFAIFLVDTNTDNSLRLAVQDAVCLHNQEPAFTLEVIAADRAVSEIWELFRQRRLMPWKRKWEPEQ